MNDIQQSGTRPMVRYSLVRMIQVASRSIYNANYCILAKCGTEKSLTMGRRP